MFSKVPKEAHMIPEHAQPWQRSEKQIACPGQVLFFLIEKDILCQRFSAPNLL